MSFSYVQKIPSPEEIKELLPLDDGLALIKQQRDASIRDIFEGKDDRFILIIGPCSADNEDAVLTYTTKLAELQEKTKEKLLLIPRVYTNKPRTTGEGYKGMIHQPNPNEKPDMVKGIFAIRNLHMHVISETGLTTADEMLYPTNYPYLEDLLSYIAVGARSVENQQHRLTVSGVDVPVGMKNPTSGDIEVMLNSIKAAQLPHNFLYNGFEVNTSGNPLAHAIMRGAVNKHGRNIPNYHFEDLVYLSEKYLERDLNFPAVIIDTNHANSMKKFEEQPRIAQQVINSMGHNKDLKKLIKGLMIESYLLDGRQDVGKSAFGQSITDPCLGWEKTERLVFDLAELV